MNCHLEDQLDEKLHQIIIDLDKVAVGLCEEDMEQRQQDPRMNGKQHFIVFFQWVSFYCIATAECGNLPRSNPVIGERPRACVIPLHALVLRSIYPTLFSLVERSQCCR